MKKTELLNLLDKYGVTPRKGKGQNFIWNEEIFKRICRSISSDFENAVEIGTGPGGLTKALSERFPKVTSFEKDPVMYSVASETLHGISGVRLINEDFLKADISQFSPKNTVITGNLPYSDASRMIVKLTGLGYSMLFMVQKEVGQRLTAQVNSPDYSFFTSFIRYYYQVKKEFLLGPEHFYPEPRIDSMVVSFTPLAVDLSCADDFRMFLKQSFSCRRKQILSNFSKEEKNALRNALEKCSKKLQARAQEFSPEELYRLFTVFKQSVSEK